MSEKRFQGIYRRKKLQLILRVNSLNNQTKNDVYENKVKEFDNRDKLVIIHKYDGQLQWTNLQYSGRGCYRTGDVVFQTGRQKV
jgi:hypothetical protein